MLRGGSQVWRGALIASTTSNRSVRHTWLVSLSGKKKTNHRSRSMPLIGSSLAFSHASAKCAASMAVHCRPRRKVGKAGWLSHKEASTRTTPRAPSAFLNLAGFVPILHKSVHARRKPREWHRWPSIAQFNRAYRKLYSL